MRVEVITVWYNEEFLAEYFLNHYSWADKIHILIDKDTNDLTESIARTYSNTSIEYINFPDGLDDILKAHYILTKYESIVEAHYVIIADADEFVFCYDTNKPVKQHLYETQKNIYFVNLWQIYKHHSDKALDPILPIPFQRKHGDPNMEDPLNQVYIKPMIIKSQQDIILSTGNHGVMYKDVDVFWPDKDNNLLDQANVAYQKTDMLQGAHWRLVDINETINRRINNRKSRISGNNVKHGLTLEYLQITENDILREYELHKYDPVLFGNSD